MLPQRKKKKSVTAKKKDPEEEEIAYLKKDIEAEQQALYSQTFLRKFQKILLKLTSILNVFNASHIKWNHIKI